MNIGELIRLHPLFASLDENALREIARVALTQSAARDELIFSEGEAATSLYLLVSGRVDLIRSTADGREQLVRHVKPHEMFAEAAMFAGESYPVTALARAPSQLITITKKRFLGVVKAHPEIAMTIIGAMAKLLRHLNQRMAELSMGSVEQRLAAYLLKCARAAGAKSFALPLQKKDLATELGTIPATLSRTLKKLKNRSAIVMRDARITIKNIEILEDLAA